MTAISAAKAYAGCQAGRVRATQTCRGGRAQSTAWESVQIAGKMHRGALHVQAVRRKHGRDARPAVFALSNPVEEAECTAQQAYDWSGGRAVFASGTAFPGVSRRDGSQFTPGQCNNCLIFPGACGTARLLTCILVSDAAGDEHAFCHMADSRLLCTETDCCAGACGRTCSTCLTKLTCTLT